MYVAHHAVAHGVAVRVTVGVGLVVHAIVSVGGETVGVCVGEAAVGRGVEEVIAVLVGVGVRVGGGDVVTQPETPKRVVEIAQAMAKAIAGFVRVFTISILVR